MYPLVSERSLCKNRVLIPRLSHPIVVFGSYAIPVLFLFKELPSLSSPSSPLSSTFTHLRLKHVTLSDSKATGAAHTTTVHSKSCTRRWTVELELLDSRWRVRTLSFTTDSPNSPDNCCLCSVGWCNSARLGKHHLARTGDVTFLNFLYTYPLPATSMHLAFTKVPISLWTGLTKRQWESFRFLYSPAPSEQYPIRHQVRGKFSPLGSTSYSTGATR